MNQKALQGKSVPHTGGKGSSITDITSRAFMSDGVARQLANEPLFPPEIMIFLQYKDRFESGRVLDLGVGSGRTTRFLAPFCTDYLGIDLSPQMLAYARRCYPGLRFSIGDLRELGQLDEPGFDFIIIAYNTIDVLDHEDRLAFLAAVRKLLNPGGLFVFSTHNRAWRMCGQPPRLPSYEEAGNLPRLVHRSLLTARDYVNHRRLAHLQRSEDDYAVVTGSHERTGLVYCIDKDAQFRQLHACGFEAVGAYDYDGNLLGETDMATESSNLHFACERRPLND